MGVLSFCRGAVSVFYGPSRLGNDGLGTSSPELSTDELRSRFLVVADGTGAFSVAGGVETAAASDSVDCGDGLTGGASNDSRGVMGPFFRGGVGELTDFALDQELLVST